MIILCRHISDYLKGCIFVSLHKRVRVNLRGKFNVHKDLVVSSELGLCH
jgi:hypothetical protein